MADDLQITGGGAVAVDTETLRQTAASFLSLHEDLDELCRRVGSLELMLFAERAYASDAAGATTALRARLTASLAGATTIADALREAAVVYELVELDAQHHAAVLAADRDAAARIDRTRDALIARHPDAAAAAAEARFWWTVNAPGDLVRESTEVGVLLGNEINATGAVVGGVALGGLALGIGVTAGVGGFGRLGPDTRLTGRGREPVTLTPVVPVATATVAPTSLAAAARRMPGGGDSRVRVERYTMPDGSRQFALYVAGMQTLAVGGDDPWDNLSNVQLYAGSSSASYEATASALAAAGAAPGDVVHAFGHSQGAMIASHLALEGEYDMRTLVSFGSPVEADAPSTLSVAIRHTDDPVAALAGAGHDGAVGAPGSFVAEREADSPSGLRDLGVPAHRMMSYTETAALVDASSDPRMGPVRDVFAELAAARSVDVVEFAAARGDGSGVSPSSEAGG
jgi:predicted esterase